MNRSQSEDSPPVRRSQVIVGWIAVLITVLITSFWGFWGIVENFHEGWWSKDLAINLRMMLVQYLSPPLLFMILGLLGLFWPRLGAIFFMTAGVGLGAVFFEPTPTTLGLVSVPLCVLGSLYLYGRARPRKWALLLQVLIPFGVVIGFGTPALISVSQRFDDGDRGARTLEVNGQALVFAPRGPGWPDEGIGWEEARRRCQFLSADGRRLAEEPQNIWRLPTVDECVRFMMRDGESAGGAWDSESRTASYQIPPEKESPLWDPYSPVVYWWTSEEVSETEAYIIVYHGGVYLKPKDLAPLSQSFRAVREP